MHFYRFYFAKTRKIRSFISVNLFSLSFEFEERGEIIVDYCLSRQDTLTPTPAGGALGRIE